MPCSQKKPKVMCIWLKLSKHMKIIISVDFSHKDFNTDFRLANVLTQEHTILLVNSEKQLRDAYSHYDLLIKGNSSFDLDKQVYKFVDASSQDIDYLFANN